MAFCMNCGQRLPEGAKFCCNCGIATGEVSSSTEQRKTVYNGELHKCPNCGELVNAFVTVCPTCHYEFRGAKASSIVKEFADKLGRIEQTRECQKPHSFMGKLYGSDYQINKTDEQKISLIRSFSIPNTKEDICEFMILAASNIDLKQYGLYNQAFVTASQRAVSDAWLAKFEQAYEKASFSFANSSDFVEIKRIYDNKIKQLKKKKRESLFLLLGLFIFILAFFAGLTALILSIT